MRSTRPGCPPCRSAAKSTGRRPPESFDTRNPVTNAPAQQLHPQERTLISTAGSRRRSAVVEVSGDDASREAPMSPRCPPLPPAATSSASSIEQCRRTTLPADCEIRDTGGSTNHQPRRIAHTQLPSLLGRLLFDAGAPSITMPPNWEPTSAAAIFTLPSQPHAVASRRSGLGDTSDMR